jgi:ubiquitin carboxyl-terminal hydrolase 5/13
LEAAINKDEVAAYEQKKKLVESDGKRLPADELVRPRIPIEACLQSFVASEKLDPFYSSGTKKVGTASKFTRLSTFPDYLVIQLKKFTIGDDWTPKKLDVTVDMPFDLDLSLLRGHGLQPGEKELPDEVSKPKEPTIDEDVVAQLVEMGFQANASRRAVITTGNAGSEAAMEWIMQHLDDPSLNDPLEIGNSSKPFIADPEALENVMCMGFTKEQAIKALQSTDNNIERAIDWIFSHPDEINSISSSPNSNERTCQSPPAAPNVSDGAGKYQLVGFVSHMGSSSMVGHYVCHILKGDQWVIFNDHKVAVSENLPKDLGYLYFYKRV